MTSKTLHETTSKKFNKTPNGKIYTSDLQDIYAMLLLALDLKDEAPKFSLRLWKRHFPFCFTLDEAVEKMTQLNHKFNLSSTSITLSYTIKHHLALDLLQKFMDAKLIHSPADRTEDTMKPAIFLQPTPKGVALLQTFCEKQGMKLESHPPILYSSLSTMRLFHFERSATTDTIVYSSHLVSLLFTKFIGDKPNVWSAFDQPELISIPRKRQSSTDFGFCSSDIYAEEESIESDHPLVQASPFAHRFFTNPDSDSLMQYYTSSKGVRMCYRKPFEEFTTEYCFTGKAALQWLMDCTDVMYVHEGGQICDLLLKSELVVAITASPSLSPKVGFKTTRDSFYTLSEKGWHLIKGVTSSKDGEEATSDISSDETVIKKLRLHDVLKDPGMLHLFRAHLESEFCSENLFVYSEISTLLDQMGVLEGFLASESSDVRERDLIIQKLSDECLSKAYSIYSTFLTVGAPKELNINHDLKQEISKVMMHPNSPCARTTFTIEEKGEIDIASLRCGESLRMSSSAALISVVSPRVDRTLAVLRQMKPLLLGVREHIFLLMKDDSLPKFLGSETFKEGVSGMIFRRSKASD